MELKLNFIFVLVTLINVGECADRYKYFLRNHFLGEERYAIGSSIGVSATVCADQCAARSDCSFVVYQYRTKFCRLFSQLGWFSFEKRAGYLSIFIQREGNETESCPSNKVFNKNSGKCEIPGCGFPQQYNTDDVTGNMYGVNNKLFVNESRGLLVATCNDNGTWDLLPPNYNVSYKPLTCRELQNQYPSMPSGVYENKYGVMMSCDLDTDGGGWTVFQRRFDGSVDFHRNWSEYKNGFGNLNDNGELWFGLKYLRQILHDSEYEFELRVDLMDWSNKTGFGLYQNFSISDETDFYRLSVGSFNGTIGDALADRHISTTFSDGQRFSTYDVDNDVDPKSNCASYYAGGWWFNSCFNAHLNGEYIFPPDALQLPENSGGLIWQQWKGWDVSLKGCSMKIRETTMKMKF